MLGRFERSIGSAQRVLIGASYRNPGIDNHPEGPRCGCVKAAGRSSQRYRYVPTHRVRGTAVRDMIFRESTSDFVLCMDCHVLFVPRALAALLDYCKAHPNSIDLLQGPLLTDELATVLTHFDPIWSAGMWGRMG